MTNEKAPERVWLTVFTDDKEPHFTMMEWQSPVVRNTQPGDYVATRPHHKVEYVPASAAPVVDKPHKRRKWVYSEDVMEALANAFDSMKGQTLPVSEVGYGVYRALLAVPEFAPTATAASDFLRDAGAIIIVNEGGAGARVEIRFAELRDAQRLHKTLIQARATAAPGGQNEDLQGL